MRYLIPIVIILVLVYCGVFLKNLDRDISQISFPLAIEKEIVIEGNIIEKLKKDLEKLYFTTDKGFLYCFDPAEKEILWKINIGRKEIITPPYVGKKNIYFLTKDELFCVNKNDGKLIWKKSFNNSKVIHLSEFRGNLYIAFNNKIQIRKSENGEITKEYEIEYPINSKIIIWTNNLIFLSIDGRIYSIPRNGRIQNLIKLSENITSDLLKDENFLYFGSDDYFYCYDLSRNRVKWKIRTGGRVACSPIVDEKRIYFACLNNVIFCLNKKGGDILWWKSIPSRVLFQLSLGRNILLVPILGDKFLAFNKKDGSKMGEFKLSGKKLITDPLIGVSNIFIGVYESAKGINKLYVLKKKIAVKIIANKPSPQKIGEEIIFKANAIGLHNPKFEFYIKLKESESFILAQELSTDNEFSWLPDKEGNYIIKVIAKDERNEVEDSIQFSIKK